MRTPFITVAHDGAIASVSLDRAEKRNAITDDMIRDIIDTSRGFAEDERTRAVVFRGAGKDFTVGADLTQPRFQDAEPPTLLMRRRQAELGMQLMQAVQSVPQPTICAVQGIATGAGACIASACDLRVAADDARIGYGEVKLGINLMWNALPLCVHLVGPARAKRMIMTGQLFDANKLLAWGFLDEVVPKAQLDTTALELAYQFAALPPIAVQMIKRSVDHVAGALDRAIMHMDADQWLLTSLTDDYREAVTAFFEKRTPKFTGR